MTTELIDSSHQLSTQSKGTVKGAVSTGREIKNSLSWLKADWHSAVYSKASLFLNTLKKGKLHFANRDINQLSATICRVNIWASFKACGDDISWIASKFRGLTSIPLSVTMYLMNFPASTLKSHFAGFNLIPYLRTVLRISIGPRHGTLSSYSSQAYRQHMLP